MQAPKELLPVYNGMYNLGLAEEDIEKIMKIHDVFSGSPLQMMMRTENSLITVPASVRYYRSGLIEILKSHKGDTKEVSKELTAIQKEALKFKSIYSIFDTKRILLSANIDIKSKSEEEIQHIGVAGKLMEKVILEKKVDLKIKHYDSIETLKTDVLDLFLKSSIVPEQFDQFMSYGTFAPGMDTIDKVFAFLQWLVGGDTTEKLPTTTPYTHAANNLYKFLKIVEKDNKRYGVAVDLNSSQYRKKSYAIVSMDATEAGYDYMDEGRIFFLDITLRSYETPGHKTEFMENPRLFILSEATELFSNPEIYKDLLLVNKDKKAFLVDDVSSQAAIKRLEARSAKHTKTKENKNKVDEKFRMKLRGLDTGTINYNGVKFTKNTIEYQGQVLSIDDDPKAIRTIIQNYIAYRNVDSLNFDVVSKLFFSYIANQHALSYTYDDNGTIENKKTTGKIGSVDFTVETKYSVRVDDSVSSLYYVNERKIKKDELVEVLDRGLCFDDQKVFNGFTKQVAACSLLVHKYLNEGIQIKVFDSYKEKDINFKLPMVRKSGVNYIVLGDNKYRVSNTAAIAKLKEATGIDTVINVLLNPSVVRIDGPDDIGYIIEKGQDAHKEAKDKNKKMIERVEDMFKLQTEDIVVNGASYRGYHIKGGITDYFLDIGKTDKETFFDRLRVFSYPTMNYVCMIDKGIDQTGPSHLINRIFALHNDSLISTEVTTLNQKN